MPSGYENSPDYGGPEPTKLGVLVLLVFIIAIGVITAEIIR